MKKLRHVPCVFLSVILVLPAFAACWGSDFVDENGNVVTDSSKIVEISLWNSGLGRKWLDDLIDAYRKEHQGYAFKVVASGSMDTFYTTIPSNARSNSFDLYFTYGPRFRQYLADGRDKGDYLEDLTSVLSGLEGTVSDGILDTLKYDGKYYAGIWQASANGLLYNKTAFDAFGWKCDTVSGLPNTTDQLADVAMQILESEKTPFINTGYTQYMWAAWWEQYSGENRHSHSSFWDGDFYDYFKNVNALDSWGATDVYVSEGLTVALDTFYDLITPPKYSHKDSNGISVSEAQVRFLSGEAMMMVNGGWLETEVAKNSDNIQVADTGVCFMKMPIVSRIVDTFDGADQGMSDEKLSEIIDWIDGGKTSTRPDCSDDTVKRIEYARNIVYTSGPEMNCFIPSYAEGKEVAKDFLKFMYSEEGTKIYINATRQIPPWYNGATEDIDVSDWSVFSKSQIALQESANYIFKKFTNPIFYRTNRVEVFYDTPSQKFTLLKGKETVSEFLRREINTLSKNWKGLCSDAGLAAK